MNYYTIQNSISVNNQIRGTAIDLFTDYGLKFLMGYTEQQT